MLSSPSPVPIIKIMMIDMFIVMIIINMSSGNHYPVRRRCLLSWMLFDYYRVDNNKI